jgi:hypothetical protein
MEEETHTQSKTLLEIYSTLLEELLELVVARSTTINCTVLYKKYNSGTCGEAEVLE